MKQFLTDEQKEKFTRKKAKERAKFDKEES